MSIFVSSVKAKWFSQAIFLMLYTCGLIASYQLFLQETNEYLGYQPIILSFEYVTCVIFFVLFAGGFIPLTITKPSDFFFLFYGLLVLVPYSVLHPIMGAVEFGKMVINIGVLIIPIIVIKFATHRALPIFFPRLISTDRLVGALNIFAIFGTAYVALNAPSAAGFDMVVLDRRLEAREVFLTGALDAYVLSVVLNGLLPFIAFYSGLTGKRYLVGTVALCSVMFFYLLGVKAHFLMAGVAWLLGGAMRVNELSKISTKIKVIVLFIFLGFFIEYVWMNYSFVADYLIRRLFSVPPLLISAYFDLFNDPLQGWDFWGGIDYPGGVTYLVGSEYFNDPDANANTNAFIHQLASGGVPMFAATTLLVAGVFFLIDSVYAAMRNEIFMYLGFIYAVLLVEQNATTALLSSGVGLLLIVFLTMMQIYKTFMIIPS